MDRVRDRRRDRGRDRDRGKDGGGGRERYNTRTAHYPARRE